MEPSAGCILCNRVVIWSSCESNLDISVVQPVSNSLLWLTIPDPQFSIQRNVKNNPINFANLAQILPNFCMWYVVKSGQEDGGEMTLLILHSSSRQTRVMLICTVHCYVKLVHSPDWVVLGSLTGYRPTAVSLGCTRLDSINFHTESL